jgi:hypothetical protein
MSVKTSTEAKAQTYAQWNVKSPFTLNSQAAALSRSDLERLEAEYHGAALPNAKGKPCRINERFWAALYSSENHTIYEPDEDRIYVYQPERGLFVAQHIENLREVMIKRFYQVITDRGAVPAYKVIPKFLTMQNMTGVIGALKGITYKKNAFERTADEPFFIHAANCMLVYNQCQFHKEEFSPSWRSRNQSPIAYEVDASDEEFRRAFFDPSFPPSEITVIQKYGGQCLLGRNFSQSILLLDGAPQSSKTTLALVISEVVGRDNCTQLRTDHLDSRFETSSFIGKSILLAPDVKANFLSLYGASILKSLVGTDRMVAEFKGSNRRKSFDGIFNVIITSNSRLRAKLEGDDDAWRRRLLIVRFKNSRVGKRISDFHLAVVRDHGSGIFNFLIRGANMLLNDIALNGYISVTAEPQVLAGTPFLNRKALLMGFFRIRT